jgi:hypothetical protein
MKRKQFSTLLLIGFIQLNLLSQEICTPSKRYDKINWNGTSLPFSKAKLYKKSIVPLGLMTLGLSLNTIKIKTGLQEKFRAPFNGFTSHADDYLQYVPTGIMYCADILKFKARNSIWNQTKFLFISELFTAGIVQTMKYSFKIQRPNDGAYNSFPSGHTSQAFVESQVLFNEFYQSSKLIALSGYLFSISTGALRVVNNQHWIPDVLMGAGIGILVTNLVYHFEPFKNWDPWKRKSTKIGFIPSINSNYIGMNCRLNL